MSGLVSALRDPTYHGDLRLEAAHEIERLQAELAEAIEAVKLLDRLRLSLIGDKQKLIARCKAAEAQES